MEKNVGWLLAILATLCLLVGGLVGHSLAPEKIVTNEVVKEVPKTVEVVKEVEKVVEKTIEVPTTDTKPLLDSAVEAFLEEVSDDEDFQRCSDVEYDEDQIEVKKLYEDYTINFDEDEYEVIFSVKLKYLDNDVEEKCYNSYDVSVLFEDEEDPVVEILEE